MPPSAAPVADQPAYASGGSGAGYRVQAYASGGSGAIGGAALLMDTIDDSFFDSLDAPPPPMASVDAIPSGGGSSPVQKAGAPTPMPLPAQGSVGTPPGSDDDDDRDEGDLLPLLEDPDGDAP